MQLLLWTQGLWTQAPGATVLSADRSSSGLGTRIHLCTCFA